MNEKKLRQLARRMKQVHSLFYKFSMDEYGAYLQFQWVENDRVTPKNITERRNHCLGVMHQDSPFVSPQNSDEKYGVEERDNAECAAVKASFGMGQELANNNCLIDDDEDEEVEEEEVEGERGSYEWEAVVWIKIYESGLFLWHTCSFFHV